MLSGRYCPQCGELLDVEHLALGQFPLSRIPNAGESFRPETLYLFSCACGFADALCESIAESFFPAPIDAEYPR